MNEKIKLLAVSDWCDSGFGRVMKELLPRLAASGQFEIAVVGWVHDGDPAEYERARQMGVTLYPGLLRAKVRNDWGKATAEAVAKEFQPDVVFTLGDPWMVDWVSRAEFRDRVKWVSYVPIDREPIPRAWTVSLAKPDVLVLYSEFGVEAIRRQMPHRHPVMIYHGVDVDVFRPLPEAERRRIKAKAISIDPDAFVVGSVARNQERKNVPATISAFKAFNCLCARHLEDAELAGARGVALSPWAAYSCPSCGSFRQDPEKAGSWLYLHMTMGDGSDPCDARGITWNIHELVERNGLKGRVVATPNYSVVRGLPSDRLNCIYNAFDVHLLTTKREGFGLPVLEAMAAGVPNVVTDYSACAELVREGGGELADVAAFLCDPNHEADSAVVSVPSAAAALHRLWADPDLRRRHAESGREFAESLTWDDLLGDWIELFRGFAPR